MEKLNEREIAILNYIAKEIKYYEDGPDTFVQIPSGFTKPQFTTSCDSLETKGMIKTYYCEGHELQDARVLDKGQCYLDDLKDARKRQLRKVLKDNNLTMDQYDLLKQAEQGNVDYNASNIPFREFKNLVFKPLSERYLVYAAPGSKGTDVVITRLGMQLLEEIEEGLYYLLANNEGYTNQGDSLIENQNPKTITPVKIKTGKKSSVIFALMSLYRINAFNTNLGRDATIDYILNVLGEKEKNNVSQLISAIFNRAKSKTPEVFINELVDGFRNELIEALAEEMSKKNGKI